MPASISAPRAASVSLSTVHHHSPKGVRCARETMAESIPCRTPDAAHRPLPEYGLTLINNSWLFEGEGRPL